MIKVSHVGKSYGETHVLRDVSFEVGSGETVCLIGPSGSGKSTLLRCINGLERHDSGRITVENDEVSPNNLQTIRRKVSMVFQRFNLFPHRTVLENVTEGPIHVLGHSESVARKAAGDLLRRVGLFEKANEYPRSLSGGQQQRVGIARALAMQPKAILFDEPTSALDPERVGEVLQVMRSLAEDGMTMIVVTHEMHFARDVADQVVFLADGVVVESAPASELLLSPREERTRQFLNRVLHPL